MPQKHQVREQWLFGYRKQRTFLMKWHQQLWWLSPFCYLAYRNRFRQYRQVKPLKYNDNQAEQQEDHFGAICHE
ncbi:hypothetical protein D3C78_1652940 [compost metagenome]